MKVVLHAVGRTSDVVPFLAFGARVHEVESAEEAEEAVASAAKEKGALIILSEEFGPAAERAPGGLVAVTPGVRGSFRTALERTRELVTRSVGVDLIARAEKARRTDE